MISVPEALGHLFDLVTPVGTETVPLIDAANRVLCADVSARRDQPPFDSSAMDGYALKSAEAEPDAMFQVIGESAAGSRFDGKIGAGQAVRIFTGAPMPAGADRVVIQEDVHVSGRMITLGKGLDDGPHVRPAGADFRVGDTLAAPRRLSDADLALLASMNVPDVPVYRKPVVALIATGDELVMPGDTPGPDQIIASNLFGLKAMVEAEGATVRMLPIAADTESSLKQVFALAEGADLIVTIGGASVGDYDLVGPVAAELGMEQSFYKVAMRPGKPLMAGRFGDAVMIGLPGNPVSAMVCGRLFLVPALRAMMGLPAAAPARQTAPLGAAISANGPREHYMRAQIRDGAIYALPRQDSSLLSVLSQSHALLIRPVGDGPRAAGEIVEYLQM